MAYQKLPQDGSLGFDEYSTAELLEGDMAMPRGNSVSGISENSSASKRFDTLDEPIKDTFKRDLCAVGSKFLHVLYPRQKATLLRDWDLWGPLMLCILMAMILQGSGDVTDNIHSSGPQFTEVFLIVWCGSAVVTLNSKLLGGSLSFFQNVCVLGYCLLPPCVSLIICRLILMVEEQTHFLFFVRFFVAMLGFVWATFAATSFLGESHPHGRKALAVFPIFLFYFFISWIVLLHSP